MDRQAQGPFRIADILRSMSDAIITVDATKRITSMNAAAETMLGMSEAEAMGRACGEVVRSEICSTRCPFESVWARGETAVNFNVALENRMGRNLSVSIASCILKNEAGEKVGVVHSIRDLRPILRLLDTLRRSEEEVVKREAELRLLRQSQGRLENLIGKSPKMREVFDLIKTVSQSDVTILVQGESGTGKELVASTIHALSHRAAGPLIKVSCAALPETLLESELFGHVRGAFTGAIKDKSGRFELADHGTIFLDEVGEMSLPIQVKLLRVLQERKFERVGGTRTVTADVRVIAATNRDLAKTVQEGRFREDLFYRLYVVPIVVPPLRERKEDIPLLINHILKKLAAKMQRGALGVLPETMELLMQYDWPGNVRELENALEFALVRVADDAIPPHSLPSWIRKGRESGDDLGKPLAKIVEEREREEIIKKFAECQGRVGDVANALGVGRTTLWRKMRQYRIARD